MRGEVRPLRERNASFPPRHVFPAYSVKHLLSLRPILSCAVLLILQCGGRPLLTPVPHRGEPPPADTASEKRIGEDPLDFSAAFRDTVPADGDETLAAAHPPQRSRRSRAPLEVPSHSVRVLLQRDIREVTVYFVETYRLTASGKAVGQVRGRVKITAREGGTDVTIQPASGPPIAVSLPCMFEAPEGYGFVEIEDNSYRGGLQLVFRRRATFSLVNILPVEEYLRGVVPLEIGPRESSEIEAVKAQAVAARTYTYRRMRERETREWDLVATVQDQVYGGITAEEAVSDRAVRATASIAITYGDSLIEAYYHSTCGGRTAAIQDVWDKPPAPYLQGIADVDRRGDAYCAISRYFVWKESWPTDRLSRIAARYSKRTFPHHPCSGTIRGMKVTRRFTCGRVGSCRIQTSTGSFEYGGDRIRFMLRRNASKLPILRSSSFEVQSIDSRHVVLSGKGYGHGVGMCQMGAVGRARAGQSFEQILSAYYPGTVLRPVTRDGATQTE